jgi:CheY-like chemotaxis protein
VPDVLIVDDDPRVRALLQLSLLTSGYLVREARDGFEALLEVAQSRPDVLVMDLSMPRIDGFCVLEALHDKGLTDGLTIVVHTSEDDPESVERAATMGIDEYFLKPIDPELVVQAIGEHLFGGDEMEPLTDSLATVTALPRPRAGHALTPDAAAL